MLSFSLRPKSKTELRLNFSLRLKSETKLNLSSSVLDQSIAMHLDRETALIA